MGIRRIFLREHNVVLTTVVGVMTDGDLREHIVALNEECVGMTEVIEIADCRHMDPVNLTGDGVMRSAELENNQPRARGGKLVIVVSSEVNFGMARIYVAVSGMNRESVNVVFDLDEAITWAGMDHMREQIHQHCD